MSWLEANGCEFPMLYFEYYAVDFRGVAINTALPTNAIILKVPTHPQHTRAQQCLFEVFDVVG